MQKCIKKWKWGDFLGGEKNNLDEKKFWVKKILDEKKIWVKKNFVWKKKNFEVCVNFFFQK